MTRNRILQQAIEGMKHLFKNSEWYYFVQEDVDKQITWILDNIEEVGVQFKNNFVALFEWQQKCRKMNGTKSSTGGVSINPIDAIAPVILKDCALPEDVYQCGKIPTAVMLFLQDFTEPKDPDVKAALHLCHQIQVFEDKNLLVAPKETKSILDLLKSSVIGKHAENGTESLDEVESLDADLSSDDPSDLI